MVLLRFQHSQKLIWAPIRFFPLLIGAAFIAVLHGPERATPQDWLLGMASATVTIAGGRFPLAVTVAQSILMVLLGFVINAPVGDRVVFGLAAIAVAELFMRRDGWQRWAGLAAFTLAQVVLYWPHWDPVRTTSSIVLSSAAPALLGRYVRSVLQVAVKAHQQRATAVREARTAERIAIARELHDLVAHHIASIAVRAGAAGHALGDAEPAVGAALAEVHGTARTALADLRRLLATLRDPATVTDQPGAALADPRGLSAAIAATFEHARVSGLHLDTEVDPAVDRLDSVRRLAVLRVVQEGLTNVVKHAGPQARASLRIEVGENVRIHIQDDGGAHPRRDRLESGFGLIGMRERVELLDGTVTTMPRSPGWDLTAVIPHPGAEEEAR